MTVLKRSREAAGEVEALAMANCLMLLSRVGETTSVGSRVFTCKTCNREFPSFQALGGHRASHKKLRLMAAAGDFLHVQMPGTPEKQKTHECSVCGLDFAIGQALGGHMRRHRPATVNSDGQAQKSAISSEKKRETLLDLNLTLAPTWLIA